MINQDPAFTSARLEALNAIDVQLVGVTHGITNYVDGIPYVEGGSAEDFDRLMNAASALSIERGDRLAIEPTGFRLAGREDITLASVLPAEIPDIPVSDMPQELQEGVMDFLESGRHKSHLNSLVYAAAHALLRGIPVHRAEVTDVEWEEIQNSLPESASPADRKEITLFRRNTKMIAQLGDIAIDMTASLADRASNAPDAERPTLLFASGRAHTPRLVKRFGGAVRSLKSIH